MSKRLAAMTSLVLCGLCVTACASSSKTVGSGATGSATDATSATTVAAQSTTTETFPPPINPPPSTTLPVPSVTDSATGAAAFSLSGSDLSQIEGSYAQWAQFDDCALEPVAGSFKAATIQTTGVSWAFGKLEPVAGCMSHTSTGGTIPVAASGDFDYGYPFDTGVFERASGGQWVMNSYESEPFPCPDNLAMRSRTPGFDTPYVPLSVLNAVGISYAADVPTSRESGIGCNNIYVEPPPR